MSDLDLSNGVALFTDGSANYRDRSGGWAWVALDADEGLVTGAGAESHTTISRMELTAAVQGLNWLYDRHGACEVLVYSDSEYVVQGANDKTRKRHKNRDCWNRLDDAVRGHSYVEFVHVRGHADHRYNEMADQLAGQARRASLQ